jgi:hypothetical protein
MQRLEVGHDGGGILLVIPGYHRKPFPLPKCRVHYRQGMVCFGIVNAGQPQHFLELRGFYHYWERFGHRTGCRQRKGCPPGSVERSGTYRWRSAIIPAGTRKPGLIGSK